MNYEAEVTEVAHIGRWDGTEFDRIEVLIPELVAYIYIEHDNNEFVGWFDCWMYADCWDHIYIGRDDSLLMLWQRIYTFLEMSF